MAHEINYCSSEKEAREKYGEYIREHITNVKHARDEYGPLICKELGIDPIDLEQRTIRHDLSKYTEAEFDPYMRRFYPYNGMPAISKEEFEKAWRHHYLNNDHHPEHWVVKEATSIPGEYVELREPIEMDKTAIGEMICDWLAMSMKFHSNTYEWWINEQEKDDFVMHLNTAKIVDEILSKHFNKTL